MSIESKTIALPKTFDKFHSSLAEGNYSLAAEMIKRNPFLFKTLNKQESATIVQDYKLKCGVE